MGLEISKETPISFMVFLPMVWLVGLGCSLGTPQHVPPGPSSNGPDSTRDPATRPNDNQEEPHH